MLSMQFIRPILYRNHASALHRPEKTGTAGKHTERDEELGIVRVLCPTIRHRHEPAMGKPQPGVDLIFKRLWSEGEVVSVFMKLVRNAITHHRRTTLRPLQCPSCLQSGRENQERLCVTDSSARH